MQYEGLPTFNIWDYVQIIFKRKWLFILPFVAVFTTTALGSFFLPKIYQSRSIILVEQKQILTPLVQGMAVNPETTMFQLDTLKEQMLSWTKLEEMISQLDLDRGGVKGKIGSEKLIKSLKKKTAITLKGDLIFISFEDSNKKTAQEVVNYVTRTFVQESLFSQAEEANSAIDFIRKQLGIYQQKLEESESALKEFKEANLFQMPGDTSNLGRALGFRNRLTELRMDIQEGYKIHAKIKNQLSSEQRFVVSEVKGINQVALNLQTKLSELQAQLQELYAKRYTDTHPWIVSLKKKIGQLELQLEQENKKVVSTETTETNPVYQELEQKLQEAEMAIESMEARERELIKLSSESEYEAKSVPEQEQELAKLTRDSAVNEKIYAMLLEKLEAANISHRLETAERGTRFRVVDPAREPTQPIKPNKQLIALMGFIVGIILGCGSVFLGEYTDHSFRSTEDIERFLGQPLLGSTSKIVTVNDVAQQKKRQTHQLFLIALGILFIGLLTFIVVFMVKS
jgi:polysaccharide chain length determinant protein (PEP-CTERM system associated)